MLFRRCSILPLLWMWNPLALICSMQSFLQRHASHFTSALQPNRTVVSSDSAVYGHFNSLFPHPVPELHEFTGWQMNRFAVLPCFTELLEQVLPFSLSKFPTKKKKEIIKKLACRVTPICLLWWTDVVLELDGQKSKHFFRDGCYVSIYHL